MYFHQIKYELACKSCKSRRPGITFLKSIEKIEHMSREDLIYEMNNFDQIHCECCGTTGKWFVLKIQLDDDDNIICQIKIHIIKQQGKYTIHREEGNFSPMDFHVALSTLKKYLFGLNGPSFQSRDNGTAFLMVDYIKTDPWVRASIIDIDGITPLRVIECLDLL